MGVSCIILGRIDCGWKKTVWVSLFTYSLSLSLFGVRGGAVYTVPRVVGGSDRFRWVNGRVNIYIFGYKKIN